MPQLLSTLQSELGANYALQRELGGGGMSRVFLAEEVRFKRPVVLKVLAPELARGVSAERFAREIELAAALQEPHIVPMLTAGTTSDGVPWYTMPYVRGESLRARLAAGAIPPSEAIELLRHVAQALAYAHREGVVHRDIKPENILLHEGTAVVTDFGIAKALVEARPRGAGGTLTTIGMSVGTPAYMAPEQGAGDPATDHRADLYAWGVVAYEMLAGVHPFAGKSSPHAWLVAHLTEPPAPLSTRAPAVAPAVAAVVMRCLEKDPDARPASAKEVIAALSSTGSGPVVAIAPSSAENTIAVLPFESLSPDPNDAFLADGLCEEIITDLARVKRARVIARNSSVLYKGTAKDAKTIGRELGARYLLTGSVRRAGSALRVTTQLVEADAGRQAWAEKFSGTMEDVFDFQERIAREVVGALSITLTPEEDARLQHRSIESLEAYECYLRARQANFAFTQDELEEALVLLDRAQALEGDTAPLLAVRAHTVWNLFNISARGPDAMDEAKRLVERALAIDPDLSPALLTRALIEMFADPQDTALLYSLIVRACERERAVDTELWMVVCMTQLGRAPLAVSHARILRQIDPRAALGYSAMALAEVYLGSDLTSLAPALFEGAASEPENPITTVLVAILFLTVGRREDARRALGDFEGEGTFRFLTDMTRASIDGDRDAVVSTVENPVFAEIISRDDQNAWFAAQALAHAGELDRAMKVLWRAAERSFVAADFVANHDQMLAPLRSHPEFPALVEFMRTRADKIAAAVGL